MLTFHDLKQHASTWALIGGGGLVSADLWHGAFTFIGAAGTFLLGVAACGQVAYHYADLSFRREQAQSAAELKLRAEPKAVADPEPGLMRRAGASPSGTEYKIYERAE